jgi:S1-C subfamily serine protease
MGLIDGGDVDDTAPAEGKDCLDKHAMHAGSVMFAAKQMIENGKVARPYVGMDIVEVTMKVPSAKESEPTQGVVSVVVERVDAGSPAHTAGFLA